MHIKSFILNKQVRNGSLFILYSFFNRGIGFILLMILANYITPSEYGQLSLFNTVVSFLGFFICLSSDGYISVSFFKKSKPELSKDVSSIFLIEAAIVTFIIIMLSFFENQLQYLLNIPDHFLWYALLICTFTIPYNVYLNYIRCEEKLLYYGMLSCGYAILNFSICMILVVFFSNGWKGQVYAHCLNIISFGLICFLLLAKKNLFATYVNMSNIKEILFWSVPLIPHLATTWIRGGLDRFIINANYTLYDVGLFSFALNLVTIVEMIGSAINSTNSVSIFKILSDKHLSKAEKLLKLQNQTKRIILITIIGTIVIFIGAYIMIPLFLPKYNDSRVYFSFLVWYGTFRALYYLYSNYFFYWGKTSLLMVITVSTAGLHLLLSLLLTQYSLIYTTLVYSITQFITLVIVCVLSKRMINRNLVETVL